MSKVLELGIKANGMVPQRARLLAWLIAAGLGPAGLLAQGTLESGGNHPGEITAAGESDSWTFNAAAGTALMLRVGATNLTPRIRVFAPDNALVAESIAGNSFARDGFLTLEATNAGTHTIIVSAAYDTQTGPYAVRLAAVPGAFVVPEGDEGGGVENGAANAGILTIGDLDLWSFQATAGDGLMLRMGCPTLTPWIRLYGPDGALVGETTSGNTFARDGFVTAEAPATGTYVAVVSATYAGQTGDYTFHVVHAPGMLTVSEGDEGGLAENGAINPGTLGLGDLDAYSFEAEAGDGLMLRVGGTAFTPWIRLYGPDGALVEETTSGNSFARDGWVAVAAPESGGYIAAVSATYAGQTGDYILSLARAPGAIVVSDGDEGGPLENGAAIPAELPPGDLDLWSFLADANDSLTLRVGGTNFTPWIRLYGPDGALVEETTSGNSFARDGFVTAVAPLDGEYTAVVSAAYSGQDGGYAVHLARAPGEFVVPDGDEGGGLVNGLTNLATLHLGDLDLWSFHGTPGDSNVFRLTATNFTPWMRIYDPEGALVAETLTGNSFARDGLLRLSITNSGLYSFVVAATFSGQAGTYGFKQSRVPPDLIVPVAQSLDESAVLDVEISAQNPDEPVKPLQFALLEAPPGLTLTLAGATNATLAWATTEADGPSTNEVVATVTDLVDGQVFTRTNRFNVVVNEINVAPLLEVPPPQTLDELTPLNVSVTASDADLPANELTFALVAPPAGMTIDPATGAIAWTPTEEQGPSTNAISVVVTDDNPWAVNARQLSTTNSFTVIVREVNTPPLLTLPGDLALDELTALAAAASATDVDLPVNPLAFRLVSPPPGLTIVAATGALSWQPTEAQGPSTNLITVVVTDDNPHAANSVSFSVTNRFTIVVNELNSAPLLAPQDDRSIAELTTLTIDNPASDSDVPANGLTYQLESAPAGATISPGGTIEWTPSEADGPSTNAFVTVVRDDGTPSLSATNRFVVVVTEVNTAPELTVPTDQTIAELTALNVSASATDSDQPANGLSFRLISPPEGMTIHNATGAITWTPTEAQGPVTNVITVVVTDDNPDAIDDRQLSVTNSFQVIVTEVNVAPGLTEISGQSLHYGTPLTAMTTATDADLPANQLTLSLQAAPEGMSIDPTGRIDWTPQQSQIGEHLVTIKIEDDGDPPLSATASFTVSVFGEGSRLTIAPLPGGLMQVNSTGETGLDYELQYSTNLVTWERLVEFRLTTPPHPYIDPASTTEPTRFYRLLLRSE